MREEYEQKLKDVDIEVFENVNEKWEGMKEAMLKVTEEVCGKTKGPPRHKETWWWNSELSDIVDKKKKCYQNWHKAKQESREKREMLKEMYNEAKRKTKNMVIAAKRIKTK